MNNDDFILFLSYLTQKGIRFYDSKSRPTPEVSETAINNLFYLPHSHKNLEIICIIDGNPLIGINRRWKISKEGDIKVFIPGTLHGEHYSDAEKSYRIFWISLLPQSLLFQMTAYVPDKGYSVSIKRFSVSPPMCRKLWDTEQIKGFANKIILQAQFHFLLMECICYILANNLLQKVDASLYHQKITEQIIDYINNYYWDDISLEHLADIVRYSPQHLNTVFKKNTNISLHHYISKVRLEKAKELLKSNNMLVKQVATACGFHDPLYFSNKFKKQFGLSPLQYQTLSQNKD